MSLAHAPVAFTVGIDATTFQEAPLFRNLPLALGRIFRYMLCPLFKFFFNHPYLMYSKLCESGEQITAPGRLPGK